MFTISFFTQVAFSTNRNVPHFSDQTHPEGKKKTLA